MTRSVEELRGAIDEIDRQLVARIAERVALARQVAEHKAIAGAPLLDPAREAGVVERAAAQARDVGIDAEELRAVMRRLLAMTRRAQLAVYDLRRNARPVGEPHD